MKGIKWIILGISLAAILGALLICAAYGVFDWEENPNPGVAGSVTTDGDLSGEDILQPSSTADAGGTTQPQQTEDVDTDATEEPVSGTTEPKPTKPKPTETKPTEPKPTETKPTQPKPTETKPTEPKPTETKPTQPKPTETKPNEEGDFSFDFSDLLG